MNYWEQAALQREIAIQEGSTYTAEEILKLYDEALEDIEREIQTIKRNFQKRFGIDDDAAEYFLTEAQKEENLQSLIYALEYAPTERERRAILEYIRRDGLSVRAYSARTERYAAVEGAIYARMKRLAADETGLITDRLKTAYKEGYYGMLDDTAKGLDTGLNFSLLNDRAIEEAIGARWHGKRFSERIWSNTDRLAQTAQAVVVKSLMTGASEAKAARELAEEFEVEKYRATTLVRTETTHIHTKADQKAYEDLGIAEYKYLATLDYRTCHICGALDGMVFKVSEIREGENYPSMHPRCRCTTTMNMSYTGRSARNVFTGKSEMIDGSVTYKEWRDGMSDEEKAAFELAQKKDSRRTADKARYAQYKSVLGAENVPKTLDEFQNVMYNGGEAYSFMKLDYNRQNRLKQHPELALPNAEAATADDRKFTEYLFNPANKTGYAKGQAFTSRLGYSKENFEELKRDILKSAVKYPATYKDTDKYGSKYEQKIILYGKKEKPANVVIGWKVKEDKTWMTSAYIKEIEK